MGKILISWVALNNDLTFGNLPLKTDGPNSDVHKYCWKYDYHLLLTSSKNEMEDMSYLQLATYLRTTYKHEVQQKAMGIDDVIE
jgi:hypothetical protein